MLAFTALTDKFVSGVDLTHTLLLIDQLRHIVRNDMLYPTIARETSGRLEEVIGAVVVRSTYRSVSTEGAASWESPGAHFTLEQVYAEAIFRLGKAFVWADDTNGCWNHWVDLDRALRRRHSTLVQEAQRAN